MVPGRRCSEQERPTCVVLCVLLMKIIEVGATGNEEVVSSCA